jgi:hypothetical protein
VGGGTPFEGNRDSHWRDVDRLHQKVLVATDTYVGTSIDERARVPMGREFD